MQVNLTYIYCQYFMQVTDVADLISTSDISYQMCYCCRKLDFETFSGKLWGRVRPWEAVWGRERPCSSHWLRQIWSDHRANQGSTASHGLSRPLTASQIRPHTASHGLSSPRPHRICHVICLSQSGEHGLSRTRPLRSVRPWESEMPIGLSRTPGDAVRSSGPPDWFHG